MRSRRARILATASTAPAALRHPRSGELGVHTLVFAGRNLPKTAPGEIVRALSELAGLGVQVQTVAEVTVSRAA